MFSCFVFRDDKTSVYVVKELDVRKTSSIVMITFSGSRGRPIDHHRTKGKVKNLIRKIVRKIPVRGNL